MHLLITQCMITNHILLYKNITHHIIIMKKMTWMEDKILSLKDFNDIFIIKL